MGGANALLEDFVNLALEDLADGSINFRPECGLLGRGSDRGAPPLEKAGTAIAKLLEKGNGTSRALDLLAVEVGGEASMGITGGTGAGSAHEFGDGSEAGRTGCEVLSELAEVIRGGCHFYWKKVVIS